MLGRLPTIYRWRTVAVVLAICVLSGAWLSLGTPVPMLLWAGLVMGGLVGILLAHVAVHDPAPAPRLVRVRQRG